MDFDCILNNRLHEQFNFIVVFVDSCLHDGISELMDELSGEFDHVVVLKSTLAPGLDQVHPVFKAV
jgi:hypothetical protein